MTNKLSFVVVTCDKDLALLKRYLQSMIMHCDPAALQEIIIIFNDQYRYYDNCKSLLSQFDQLPIKLLWSNEIWPEQNQYDWYSQQQLKLLAADLVSTTWYIVNDSKDFYFGNISYDDFIDAQGVSVQPVNIVNHHEPWFGPNGNHRSQYVNAYDLFGLRFEDYKVALRTTTASICPLHTESIQQLLSYLRGQFGTLFPMLLLLQMNYKNVYTEYALVSAWLQKHNQLLSQYSPTDRSVGFHTKAACNKDLRRGT